MKSKLRTNESGDEFWILPNRDYHKEDGPAVEFSHGDKEWWINGKLHRKNGPAVELNNGDKQWWSNGELHREDGPAVEFSDGDKEWWINGKLHRENGPAVELNNGDKQWWSNGELHREDGPAVKQKYFENWYLNDVEYTKEEFINSREHKAYTRGVKLKRLLIEKQNDN
jgi:hypothetical protein